MLKKKYEEEIDEEVDKFNFLSTHPDVGALELSDYIENMLENKPLKKNKESYKTWEKRVNILINRINNDFGNLYKLQ